MRDEHIIRILDDAPLSQLGEGELAAVRAHAAGCAECRRAYEAAKVASLLLRERAAAVEPSPFFQTRVLAALRERRAGDEMPTFRRLWRAAGALATSMAATVVLLAGLTFAVPGLWPTTDTTDEAAASDPYSAEAALIAQDEMAGDEMDYEQVFTAIYASDGTAGGNDE